jgi:hypothetical protein
MPVPLGRRSAPRQLAVARPERTSPAVQLSRHEALCWKHLVCSSRSPKAILVVMTGRATSTSLVGREEELRRLQQGLQSAAAGEPGTLLIAGEAGIGKTRLVQEFAERIGGESQVLLGSCIQLSGGGLRYGPIVDALRPLARDLDPADLDELLGPTPDDLLRLLPQRHGRHGGWPSRLASMPRSGCSSWSWLPGPARPTATGRPGGRGRALGRPLDPGPAGLPHPHGRPGAPTGPGDLPQRRASVAASSADSRGRAGPELAPGASRAGPI